MTDHPHDRPADTGDGDNYDPTVHDPDLGSSGSSPSAPADGSGGRGAPGDDDERASEVDDVTRGTPRPTPTDGPLDADELEGSTPGAPGSGAGADADRRSHQDLAEEIADAVDEAMSDVDFSDVDVEAVLVERDEFKSMAQRIQADFDNFRRQSATRAQADADRATGRLAEAMLPVLDAAEAAYLRHPEEVGPLLNQMLVELKRHGLETLDLDGQPFDPEVAEAVAHEPADGGEPVVAEVLRSGYRWKGRTLRPAMVKTTD